jgi:hypothetical protein
MAQVLPGGQMNQGGNFVIMSGPPGGPQFFRPPMPQMMQSAVARPGFAQNGAAPVIMMGGQPRPIMMPVTSQYPK